MFSPLPLPLLSLLHLCLLLLCQTPRAVEGFTIPSSLQIGGLFRNYYFNTTRDLVVIPKASQHVAAYVMAMDEVNNKTDGQMDSLLPSTELQMVVNLGFLYSISQYPNPFFDGGAGAYYLHQFPNTVLSLGTADDLSTESSLDVFKGWDFVGMITNSTKADFSNHQNFPTSIRLPPSEAFQSQVLAQVIADHFGWAKVSIFYSTSVLANQCLLNFRKASIGKIAILSEHEVAMTTVDYETIVKKADKVGSRIFVVFADASTTASLLEAGVSYGLFTQSTQVIVLSEVIESGIADYFTSDTIAMQAMHGMLAVKPQPSLYFQTDAGKSFLKRFRSLSPTIFVNPVNGHQSCSNRNDSTGINLYQASNRCMGFSDFSQFAEDGSDLDPYILYTYEGVIIAATVIHQMIEAQLEVNRTSFLKHIMSQDTISIPNNIIGQISFFKGDRANALLGYGDREVGHIYSMYNFRPELFQSRRHSPFAPVAVWTSENGTEWCAESTWVLSGCVTPKYADGTSSPPRDSPPDLIAFATNTIKNVYIAFAAVLFISQVGSVVFLVANSSAKSVRYTQPRMTIMMIFGGILGSLFIITGAFQPTDSICIARFWLENMSFRVVFGTMYLKLYRLHSIINPDKKRRCVTEGYILGYLVWSIVVMSAVMVPITIFGNIHAGSVASTHANQRTNEIVCQGPGTEIAQILMPILIFIQLMMLVFSLYYLWQTRQVPPQFNESMTLAPVLFWSVITIVCTILLVTVFAIPQAAQEILVTSNFIFILTFGNIKNSYAKIRDTLEERKRLAEAHPGPHKSLSKVQQTLLDRARDQVDQRGSFDEKFEYIQHQLHVWNNVMINVATSDSVDTSDVLSPTAGGGNKANRGAQQISVRRAGGPPASQQSGSTHPGQADHRGSAPHSDASKEGGATATATAPAAADLQEVKKELELSSVKAEQTTAP